VGGHTHNYFFGPNQSYALAWEQYERRKTMKIGEIKSTPVYKLSSWDDDYRVVSVCVRGKNKGTVLAVPGRNRKDKPLVHWEIIRLFDPEATEDNYVRFDRIGKSLVTWDYKATVVIKDKWDQEEAREIICDAMGIVRELGYPGDFVIRESR